MLTPTAPREAGVAPARHFYARGKLLLTGEYLVLDGATALAAPTRRGQGLRVTATEEVDVLHWLGRERDGGLWVEEAFTRAELAAAPPPPVDKSPRARLARLLRTALTAHPLLWPRRTGLRLESRLEFARDWGLGSSATLAYLLAAWAGADAFDLNRVEFGGSGYDVACAGADGPLRYRLARGAPVVEAAAWAPAYLDRLWLVHLGRKQDSRDGIAAYRRAASGGELPRYVAELDAITDEVHAAPTAAALAEALRRHEALVGYVTHQQPLGRGRFADFPGAVKSLGAWGGDFALAVATAAADFDVPGYFAARGFGTVVPARELLLTSATDPAVRPEAPGDWPAFLYGPLAEPRVDNEWLGGRPHRAADLLGYAPRGARLAVAPGRVAPGTLVWLSPEEVREFDLHPAGAGLRRTQLAVRVGEGTGEVRAMVWL